MCMLKKRDDSCPGGDGKTKMIHVLGVVERGDKSFILLPKQLTIFTYLWNFPPNNVQADVNRE